MRSGLLLILLLTSEFIFSGPLCSTALQLNITQLMRTLKFNRVAIESNAAVATRRLRGEFAGFLFYSANEHSNEVYTRFRNNTRFTDSEVYSKDLNVELNLGFQDLSLHLKGILDLARNFRAQGVVLRHNSQLAVVFESESYLLEFSAQMQQYSQQQRILAIKIPEQTQKTNSPLGRLDETPLPNEFLSKVSKLDQFPAAFRTQALKAARSTMGLELMRPQQTSLLPLVRGQWPKDPHLKFLALQTREILNSPKLLSVFFLDFFYEVGLEMQKNPKWQVALEKGVMPREAAYEVFNRWQKQMGFQKIGHIGNEYLNSADFRAIIAHGPFIDLGFKYGVISHGIDGHVFQLFFVWKTLADSGHTDFSQLLRYLSESDSHLLLWNDLFDNPNSLVGRFTSVELLTEIYTQFTGLR